MPATRPTNGRGAAPGVRIRANENWQFDDEVNPLTQFAYLIRLCQTERMTWSQTYQFTPAAWRALHEAARWAAAEGFLDLPELLLGLAAESECRAALLLAKCGVDQDGVQRRFPHLARVGGGDARAVRWSMDLRLALAEVSARLFEDESALGLATEHLLLGILSTRHEAAAWLAEHGLAAETIEAEIHRLYGHDSPDAEEALPWPTGQESAAPAANGRVAQPIALEAEEPESASCPRTPPATRPLPEVGILRAFDAAANRGREGLRVAEDYVRFVLDDRHLTDQLKRLRHDLAAALARVPAQSLLAAREVQSDVGTSLTTPSEALRADGASLAAANFKRAQEALRSLEEFSKALDPAVAADVKQLRYRAYTLERAVAGTAAALDRLRSARLCVLLDGRESLADFVHLAENLIAVGVHVLQLRDKRLPDGELLARARALRRLTRGTGTLFIVNDRPDLAALSEADGVHLGQEEMSVKGARRIVGPQALIGVSTHSLPQARQAVLDGADYLGVGPTFPSRTKAFDAFTGTQLIAEVAAEIRLPAFAIGGIDAGNLGEVLAAGGERIAVGGAVLAADDPAAAAAELLRGLRVPAV